MKRPNVLALVAVVPALICTDVVLTLAKFDLVLFRDPFSVSRFVVKAGVLLGFTWLFMALLRRFWKGGEED
ncbi:MAG TPA: hypothetical protein VFD85_15010 [Gemmatimonadales bacterium]|nr:hypothetical protein [Gemmatimonadales bacterium]